MQKEKIILKIWGQVNEIEKEKSIVKITETKAGSLKTPLKLLQAWVPLEVTQAPPGPDTNSQKNDLKIQFLQKGAGHPISQAPPKYLTRLPSYAFTEAVFTFHEVLLADCFTGTYYTVTNLFEKGNKQIHTKKIHSLLMGYVTVNGNFNQTFFCSCRKTAT